MEQNSFERLFDHIEDDDTRRDLESTVQRHVSKFDFTLLTNSYREDDSTVVLQLYHYDDNDHLYGTEMAVPRDLDDEGKVDMFETQLVASLKRFEEEIFGRSPAP